MTKLGLQRSIKYDYVQNNKGVIAIHLTIVCLIYAIFTDNLTKYLSSNAFFLISTVIFFTLLLYFIINHHQKWHETTQKFSDFRSFSYKYLSVKIVELYLQQVIIQVLLLLTKNSAVYFILVFVLLHLHNYLYKDIRTSTFYLLFSIPGAFLFYYIYNLQINFQFGLAYLVHLFFYLIAGLISLHSLIERQK